MRSSFVCSEIFCFSLLKMLRIVHTYKSINCLHVIYHIVPITKQLSSNNLNNVESPAQEKLNKIIRNTQLPFCCARDKDSTTIRLLSIRSNGRDHDSA